MYKNYREELLKMSCVLCRQVIVLCPSLVESPIGGSTVLQINSQTWWTGTVGTVAGEDMIRRDLPPQ